MYDKNTSDIPPHVYCIGKGHFAWFYNLLLQYSIIALLGKISLPVLLFNTDSGECICPFQHGFYHTSVQRCVCRDWYVITVFTLVSSQFGLTLP